MKRIITLLLLAITLHAKAQHCPNVNWTLPDPVVCDVNYGDASGNSPWNWEIDRLDPDYCKMWYARIGVGQITPIGSPFMTSATITLAAISSAKDYTKEKGWVLLKRDFGCEKVTNYPYFVLYNKYRGILRVFVFQPATAPQNSGLMVVVSPTTSAPYPALTAMGDAISGSAEQFRNENSNEAFGKSVIAVGEQGGPSSWTMVEMQMGFDPNVGIYDYSGTGLQFKIYNVLNFDMKAVIKGRMVTGADPKIYNYNYVPTTDPEDMGNDLEKFVAAGQKVVKLAKTIEDGRKEINKSATDLAAKLLPETGVKQKIGKAASGIAKFTSDANGFGKGLSQVLQGIGAAGSVLNLLGNVMGIFSESEPALTYSSINLELQGSLTARNVGQTFIIRVPGSRKDPNDPQDYLHRPYYDCPLGIITLSNIPRADVVTYKRAGSFDGYTNLLSAQNHKSYRLKNDLVLALNEKAGLELVTAQVAFVGEIQQGTGFFNQGKAGYLPLVDHESSFVLNYMLPDFQSGRLEMVNYDSAGFHTFRTAYADIGCANGLTFNVLDPTLVYLRVIAVLKRKDDPSATPILFSKDYAIKADNVELPQATKDMYLNSSVDLTLFPPYTNLTVLPSFRKNIKLENAYLSNGAYVECDNDIYTVGSLISPTNAQNVILNAGNEITLNPGFEAGWGTTFTAQINRYGYNLTCINPIVDKYNPLGGCFNTSAVPNMHVGKDKLEIAARAEEEVSVYPVPSGGKITIEVKGGPASAATISDLSGKMVHQQFLPNAITSMNLKHLPNGVYFIKITYPGKVVVKKILLNK